MSCDMLTPAWWNRNCAFVSPARTILARPGSIHQANSSVVPYSLVLEDGSVINAVIKKVDFRKNRYRNAEHGDRSLKSYQVEVEFYSSFADKLAQSAARIPQMLHQHWEPGTEGLILALQDLSCPEHTMQPSHEVSRHTHQALIMSCHQAELALDWLSCMHAAFWRWPAAKRDHIWPQGSYWSLDKRRSDVANIAQQWSQISAAFQPAFPEVFGRTSVQNLGPRLAAAADKVQRLLHEAGVPDGSSGKAYESALGWTVIHGDFKTANLFFWPDAAAAFLMDQKQGTEGEKQGCQASVSACDFQWCGGGIGEQDVMYLLWSSVSPHALQQHELKLLRHYFTSVQQELQLRGIGPMYSFAACCHRYQLAFIDYVRFLVGAMWGSVTPATCEGLQGDINQGLHKRSAGHLINMVQKADFILQQLEDKDIEMLSL